MPNDKIYSKEEYIAARDELLRVLDILLIDKGVKFSLHKNIHYNNLRSFVDNFNDYVTRIKTKVKEQLKEEYSTSYLLSLTKEVNDLLKIKNTIHQLVDLEEFNKQTDYLKNKIFIMFQELNSFIDVKDSFRSLSFNAISNSLAAVNDELKDFRKRRNIVDNARTEQIYNNAVNKYRDTEWSYRILFIATLISTFAISVTLLLSKQQIMTDYKINGNEFWILKVSIVLIGITLVSYFLKQSSHYQKLADQNYQTQVELQAYPSFMESIPTSDAAAIRKELALKYFGRDLDSSPHKDMSNLISDQMKNATELVKASAAVVKSINQPATKPKDTDSK